jgi:AraC family transcriptional regulator
MTAPAVHLFANDYAPGTRHPVHEHEELQISLILRGAVEERVGGAVERGGALSVVVKDPGVRHADDFGRRGAFIARLSVPRADFACLVEDAGRAAPWRWTHDARVAAPFLRIVNRGNVGERSFATDDVDVVDLVAAISSRPDAPAGAPPQWLAATVRELREGWTAGLTVAGVARRARVHPVYLARCIRRWYGIAAAALLRDARLRHAADALVDGHSTVSSVAHGTGFSDEAHLCRSFVEAAGCTPARFRSMARAFGG